MSLLNRINNIVFFWRNQPPTWRSIERFDPIWKKRIATMAQFIPKETKVLMDLGCGPMWLSEMIASEIEYLPVDYKRRGSNTLIFDLNKYQYPEIPADVTFVSGCLEYIVDYDWIIGKICENSKIGILSYCALDNYPNISERESNAWVNHLSKQDIINLFEKHHFQLVHLEPSDNIIFVFEKKLQIE